MVGTRLSVVKSLSEWVVEINVITIFPDMCNSIARYGIIRQAVVTGALKFASLDPRTYASGPYRAVDDRPYGGGPGMVMKPRPLADCIDAARASAPGPVVYLTPQGEALNQSMAQELAALPGLILLAGRYEGIDERIVESRVEREISIGDYVLAGGELAAMVIVEAIARLLPGVLGNRMSAQQDSFCGGLLDCPHFTRPECFEGRNVPPVLLSGDHEKIRQWRLTQALVRTGERRPDLIANLTSDPFRVDDEQIELLNAYQLEQEDE